MISLRRYRRRMFAGGLLSAFSAGATRRRRLPPGVAMNQMEGLERRALLSASPGVEAAVNSTTAGTQRTHTAGGRSVDTAADGSSVSVWSSTVGDGSGWGVFGQRFDASGAKVGGEFAVNVTTEGDQNNAAVAVRDDGSFVVTWQSRFQDGSDFGVYARVFAADGTPLSGEIAVNTMVIGTQQLPVVSDLVGDGFAIAWNGRGVGDANGVYFRVFDSTGVAVTEELAANTTKEFAQTNVTIAADAEGGFGLAWHGNGGSDRKNVMFRHFDGEGNASGPEVVVNETLAGIQKTPAIALTQDGNFVVAWSGNGAGDDDGIFARRIDTVGTALGGEILVNSETADKQTTPSIVGTADNGFAVTWASQSSPGENANFEIMVREFSGADVAQYDDVLVNTTLLGRQWNPIITSVNGSLFVTWSGRGIGDSFGVFGSWITSDEAEETLLALPS